MAKATNIELKYKSWAMLPIGKYEHIKEIIRDGVENSDVEILSVLCDCDVNDILNAPVSKVMQLKKDAMYLNTKLNVKDRLKYKHITIDGVKYVVHTDFKDITTAQYIDFQTFYKDYEKNYCNVLATFIIPEGHQYNDGYDALETAELFREKMPVEVAENACFFFACRCKSSLSRGLRRLIWATTMKAVREKNPTVKGELLRTREELMKQNDAIAGLARSMRLLIQSE